MNLIYNFGEIVDGNDPHKGLKSILAGAAGGMSLILARKAYVYFKKERPYQIFKGRCMLDIIKEDDVQSFKAACSLDKRFLTANDYHTDKNALYYATSFGSIRIFNALEEMGVKQTFNDRLMILRRIKTKKIETALAKNSLAELKEILNKEEFDINTRINPMGDSMLQYAIENDCAKEIIKFLIESGGDICKKDEKKQTIIELAINHFLRPLNPRIETIAMRVERIDIIELLLYCNPDSFPCITRENTPDPNSDSTKLYLEIERLLKNRMNLDHHLPLKQREEFSLIAKKRAKVLGQKFQAATFDLYPEAAVYLEVYKTAVSPLVGEYLGSLE